jgi:hypothetical protein
MIEFLTADKVSVLTLLLVALGSYSFGINFKSNKNDNTKRTSSK